PRHHVQPPRPRALRSAGALGGLAAGLAPGRPVRVVAAPRRVRDGDPRTFAVGREERAMSDAVAGRALPAVVTRDEWEAARAELRAEEMEVAARLKELAAKRKRLPMRVVDEPYLFDGPSGRGALAEMFEWRHQLCVYHFLFPPDWEAGCEGCTMLVDGLPPLAYLNASDVTFALGSSAPLEALLHYRERMCWEAPWYSSAGASFNLDLGATV